MRKVIRVAKSTTWHVFTFLEELDFVEVADQADQDHVQENANEGKKIEIRKEGNRVIFLFQELNFTKITSIRLSRRIENIICVFHVLDLVEDVEVGQGQDQDPVEETGIRQKGEDREDTDISLCY